MERFRYDACPTSRHPIDAINLADPAPGAVRGHRRLAGRGGDREGAGGHRPGSRWSANVGLTVNEYETLLMQHDLREVLQNPLKFAAQKGRHMLDDPLAIPGKTINYARYDVVRVLNLAHRGVRRPGVGGGAAHRQGDGGAGPALPADAADLLPGLGPLAGGPGPRRARHLPEPHPRAVAAPRREARPARSWSPSSACASAAPASPHRRGLRAVPADAAERRESWTGCGRLPKTVELEFQAMTYQAPCGENRLKESGTSPDQRRAMQRLFRAARKAMQ